MCVCVRDVKIVLCNEQIIRIILVKAKVEVRTAFMSVTKFDGDNFAIGTTGKRAELLVQTAAAAKAKTIFDAIEFHNSESCADTIR